MSTEDKAIIKSMCAAITECTDEQKMWFLGFAEGVAMMAKKGDADEDKK